MTQKLMSCEAVTCGMSVSGLVEKEALVGDLLS